ncbi:probable E3 ubiquitin-protein ligase RNF217 [Oryza brachyantha]|uniref:probable E3 ubiquitin-protein ligase RNF217 n=1 Tax=Oryza brachyantha TaxID=4533 RepID=UPI001ADB048A|nr:probable E3 ubiquitin-protein ligase RNF217 [Oryza brachyantha]
MASGSSGSGAAADLTVLVDDFYFSVLSHGRNDGDIDDDELFPISDEKYASELQLQEVIMSSSAVVVADADAASSSRRPMRPVIEGQDVVVKGNYSYAASSSRSSTSTPSAAAAAATLVFCKICMDSVPPSDAHRACRGCEHAFCADCLAGYIGAKIQDRIADVRCPEERCRGVLDPELCQGIIPREVFERWGAALCEAMVLVARRAYCPFRDCSAMMLDDADGGGDAITESECPSCRRLFCARCAVPWHVGLDCAAYKKLGKGDRGKEDLLLLQMAEGRRCKRCPKCKYFVEKSQGCLHITCRCGFEFCYGCGGKWGATHSSCSTS